jgi:hypothetical protein
MKLLEEEERRIILNGFNFMARKYPDTNVIFHFSLKSLAVLSLEILRFCRLGVYNISKIHPLSVKF